MYLSLKIYNKISQTLKVLMFVSAVVSCHCEYLTRTSDSCDLWMNGWTPCHGMNSLVFQLNELIIVLNKNDILTLVSLVPHRMGVKLIWAPFKYIFFQPRKAQMNI